MEALSPKQEVSCLEDEGSEDEAANFNWLTSPLRSEIDEDSEIDVMEAVGGLDEESPKNCIIRENDPQKSWFGKVLNKVWSKHCDREQEMKALGELTKVYTGNLKNIFKVDGLPPDIVEIAEILLEYQSGEESTEDDIEITDKTKLENVVVLNELTLRLKKLLVAATQLILQASDIDNQISNCILENGVLLKDTPEQILCKAYGNEMLQLLSRHRTAVKLTKKYFKGLIKDDIILSALNSAAGSWAGQLDKMIASDIHYSVVSRLNGMGNLICQALCRMTMSLCYLVKKELFCEVHEEKLKSIVMDYTILVNTASNGLAYQQEIFRNQKEADCLQDSKPTIVGFTREQKLLKQCNVMLKWSQQFETHMERVKMAACQLVELKADLDRTDDCIKNIDKLQKMHEKTYDFVRILKKEMDTQSLVMLDISRASKAKGLVEADKNKREHVQNVEDEKTEEEGFVDAVESIAENAQQWELNSVDFEESSDLLNTDDRPDEVFVAIFRDQDETKADDVESQREDADVERLSKALFCGVVTQLKEALVPVQTKMTQREKDAIVKTYGDATEDLSEDNDKIGDLETPSSRNDQSDEEEIFEAVGGTTYCSSDINVRQREGVEGFSAEGVGQNFLLELKTKLGQGMPHLGLNEIATEEFTCESESENDDVD